MAEGLSFTQFADRVLGAKYSPAQRVYALVAFDGVDPCRLDAPDRELARTLFGDVDEIPPAVRRVLVAVLGRGSGKDELGADYSLFRMLTADIRKCGVGDVPSAIVIAPDMKLATITKNRALEKARQTPAIARCIEAEGGDGFAIRRPQDGRLVAFEVLAATRAGSAARGRSVLCALLSECAFFRDESAAVNDSQVFAAIMPRLMAGGALLLFSTPWAEAGLFFELFEKNRGKPQTALVAQASTLVMRDGDPDVAALVASETERDEVNASREYGAQFIGIGSASFFDPASIDAAVDSSLEHPLPMPPYPVGRGVGVDLGFKLDASAQVIVFNERLDDDDRVTVAYVDEVRPTPGFPLSPTEIVRRFARGCEKYQVHNFMCDAVYEQSIRELAGHFKIAMYLAPAGNGGKVETYLAAKELFTEGRVRIPKHPRLIAQLKAVISRPRPGGIVKIEVPRRVGQSHGDIASAAVLALYQARQANAGKAQREELRKRADRLQWVGALAAGVEPERYLAVLALANGASTESITDSIHERLARVRPRDESGKQLSGLTEADAAAHDEMLRRQGSPAWSGHKAEQARLVAEQAEKQKGIDEINAAMLARFESKEGKK